MWYNVYVRRNGVRAQIDYEKFTYFDACEVDWSSAIDAATLKAIIERARVLGAAIPESANEYYNGGKNPELYNFRSLSSDDKILVLKALEQLGLSDMKLAGIQKNVRQHPK